MSSAKAKSQFVQVPPLENIQGLFTAVTGCTFEPLVTWSSWRHQGSDKYSWLEAYIRPCHQKILLETKAGIQKTPCALLRQLLRPYDYHISAKNGIWTLTQGKVQRGVHIIEKEEVIFWS
jgi:hypothetical protein